jgi:hypothetical protein
MIENSVKYDKQDQQGKAACNERNPNTTQQQVAIYFVHFLEITIILSYYFSIIGK